MPLPSPVFSGDYITAPSDFYGVAQERDLIRALDDEHLTSAASFDLLDNESQTIIDEIVGTMNEIIHDVEDESNTFFSSAGYAIPLDPVDPYAKRIVVDLAWLALRQRKGVISSSEAADEKRSLSSALRQIARGTPRLTSAASTDAGARASVYKIESAERQMSRDRLKF